MSNLFKHSLGAFTDGKFYAIPYQASHLRLVWDVTVIKKGGHYNSETRKVKIVADSAIKAAADAISKWDAIIQEEIAIIANRRADNKKVNDGTETPSEGTTNTREVGESDKLAFESIDGGD
jgi:hypothetical protein